MSNVDLASDLREEQVVDELERVSSTREDALSILGGALLAGLPGLEAARLPPFGSSAPRDWFREVTTHALREGGDGAKVLLSEATRLFPGKRARSHEPVHRKTSSISILLEDDLPDEQILEIVRASRSAAASLGMRASLDLVERSGLCLSFEDTTHDRLDTLAERIRASIRPGLRAAVMPEEHGFRDYFLDPIYAEGPDGQRFSLDHVRASTRLVDVAQGILELYDEAFWPMGKGEKASPVVDLRRPGEGGARRLFSRQTLHDAGVRPFDLLEVHPERRAGSVNPFLLTESLSMVKNQILEFARTNPGFEVQANAVDVPTEYLVRFRAPGFAPGDPPRRIDEHEVLLVLPPDFPVKAPEAYFQRPVFHPNVDRKTGLVCLGVLAESYRPGLHFGTLCQMLVDMASYRNYELREGYDMEATAWAASAEGQAAIASIGGRPWGHFDDQGRRGRIVRASRISA